LVSPPDARAPVQQRLSSSLLSAVSTREQVSLLSVLVSPLELEWERGQASALVLALTWPQFSQVPVLARRQRLSLRV